MSAPLTEVLGTPLAFLLTVTLAALSLALTRLYRHSRASPPEYPRYYLSGIASYLAGETRTFPRRDILFVARSLVALGYMKRRRYILVALLVSLIKPFSSIYPFSRRVTRLLLKLLTGYG